MASAITLTGIDQAVSHLKYASEITLKYRFVQLIRNYYVDDNSLIALKKIDHVALIKLLWDTHDDLEVIKNKRKNLTSLRSAVNADLKKLYENGLNPEGIKIGPNNIFIMSEDAKDNILNTFGYELQPDGTLKLDQIMDILKLANETASGELGAEDITAQDGLSKKDQLKDLIKRLSEKLGLGHPEFLNTGDGPESQESESRVLSDNIGKTVDIEAVDENKVISEMEDIEEDEVLEEVGDTDEIVVVDEDGILDAVDEDILDDAEDIETNDIEDSNPEILTEEEIDEDIEDTSNELDADIEYIDIAEDDPFGDCTAGEPGDDSGTGVENFQEGLSKKQGLEQGKDGNGLDERGSMIGDLKVDFETGDKVDGKGIGVDTGEKGDENRSGIEETNDILDDAAPDAVDEITKLDDVDEIETIDEDELLDDIDEEILDDVENVITEDVQDLDMETVSGEEEIEEILEDAADDEDTELEYIDISEDDGVGGGIAGEPADESGAAGNEKENEIEHLGLPIDSLGQEYGTEKETRLKKDKLLAEAFDGYLGSMDRYYNHYILIDGGRYLIGSRHPKKGEEPERIVSLEPFYFGRFPVTNGLFEIFVEKTGYITTAEKVGYGTVYYGRFEKRKDDQTGLITSEWHSSLYCNAIKGACWYRPSGPESTLHNKRNHPVVQISLEDAAAFAAWTGKRLPTESEWEAASRTAKGWIFPWGHDWQKDAGNIEDSGIADTTPVDKYAEFENDSGIVDVLGNVLEWTDDGFGMMSQENNASTYRIAKGGSWVSGNDIRLFSRFKLEPDSHSNILGFRCVAY